MSRYAILFEQRKVTRAEVIGRATLHDVVEDGPSLQEKLPATGPEAIALNILFYPAEF